MMEFLKKLKAGYMAALRPIAMLMTWVWMILIYFLVIPFFTPIKLKDPLRKNLSSDSTSYWCKRTQVPQTIERHMRPF